MESWIYRWVCQLRCPLQGWGGWLFCRSWILISCDASSCGPSWSSCFEGMGQIWSSCHHWGWPTCRQRCIHRYLGIGSGESWSSWIYCRISLSWRFDYRWRGSRRIRGMNCRKGHRRDQRHWLGFFLGSWLYHRHWGWRGMLFWFFEGWRSSRF